MRLIMKAFYEVKGVGYALRGPQVDLMSVSLDASYHKEQKYIWFKGGDLNGFWDISILWSEGGGASPRETLGRLVVHDIGCIES